MSTWYENIYPPAEYSFACVYKMLPLRGFIQQKISFYPKSLFY